MDEVGAPLKDAGVRATTTSHRNTPARDRSRARHRTLPRPRRIDEHQDPAPHPHRVRVPRIPTTHRARDARPRITPTASSRPQLTHGSNRRATYLPIGTRSSELDRAIWRGAPR